MNENYKHKITGTINCTRTTTIGHILAHIENARQYFGIISEYWGGPLGFEYSEIFPDYINRVVREIDIKYSVNQDRMHHYVKAHEADYATPEEHVGEWPHVIHDYGLGIFENVKPDRFDDDDRQVQIWISGFRYMLHDAIVSYVYAIGEKNESQMIEGFSDNELKSIACDLSDWKSSSREDEQIEGRRMLEKTFGIQWENGKPYIPTKEDA